MKTLLKTRWAIITSCIICLSACSYSGTEVPDVPTSLIAHKYGTRTINDAVMIAQRARRIFFSQKGTRSEEPAYEVSTVKIIQKNPTRIGDIDSDTILYIVNFTNDAGFAIVSANANITPLLAISDSGEFPDEDGIREYGLSLFMDAAKHFVTSRIHDPIPIDTFEVNALYDTVTTAVGPFIQVAWGANSPIEGKYCPNHVAGCAPVAAAQLMSYYQYPDTIELMYNTADMTFQPLDWEDICKHKIYYSRVLETLSCEASNSAHNAIGRLCRQLGYLMNSDYYSDNNNTSTGINYIYPAMQALGYTRQTEWWSYNEGYFKNGLNRCHPLYIAGTGHAWLCDGYRQLDITKYYLLDNTPPIHWTELYNHFNWGWNGRGNGYYLDMVFVPSQYEELDSLIQIPPTDNNDYGWFMLDYIEMYPQNQQQ